MKPEQWQQVDQLFHAALEHAPGERAAFLREACIGDDSLRREVESLLVQDAEAGSFIADPAYAVAASRIVVDETPSLEGQSISHYRIISLVGTRTGARAGGGCAQRHFQPGCGVV